MKRIIVFIKTVLFISFLMVFVPVFSQTKSMKDHYKKERLSKIDMFHYAVGLEGSFNKAVYFSPEVKFGVGSFRNFINVDVGLRYMFGNPFFNYKEECLVVHQIPLFVSVQFNAYSWNQNRTFIGAEMAYIIPITVFHHYGESENVAADNNVGNSHFSCRATIGLQLKRFCIELFYEYDFAPIMNQKYVYESANYDYDVLQESLLERARFGMSLTYYFVIKL